MKLYAVDLHSDLIVMDSWDKETNEFRKVSLRPDTIAFEKFINGLRQDDIVAIEASTNTFHYFDLISPRVKECIILNPRKMDEIFRTGTKTDKRDAEKILHRLMSYYVSGNKSSLPEVYVPVQEVRELRRMFTTYQGFKKEIVMLKNNIHSLLKLEGVIVNKKDIYTNKTRKDILELKVSIITLKQLQIQYQALDALHECAKEIKKVILKSGEYFHEEVKLLVSIKGISPFTAIAVMADIADISRFPSAKKLSSYLRTAPRIDKSNKTVKIGRINKESRKLTLGFLLQSVNHFIQSSDRMNEFYERVKQGRKACKSRIAVCRKTICIIYHMLTRKQLFYYMDKENYHAKLSTFEKAIA